ncbi:MAG: transposase [Rhodocyclaceae bacterium]|nr:transposase [Rhodocyclaceae bacterium]
MSRYRRSLADGATFFFTVNLADRKSNLLVREIDRLRRAFQITQSRHPFETVAICVLPEHLHAIWALPTGDANFGGRWRAIKRLFSSGLPAAPRLSESKILKREKGVWQRRFWEHQIRDELDLQRHVDYIHHNPVKHGYVERVVDWPHSSFHRYVRNGILAANWGYAGDEPQGPFGE